MLFNSSEFLLFLPIVFAGYWLLGRHLRFQNLFVVVASYVFYGWWDWRFLALIVFTSAWSWAFGLLEANAAPRSTTARPCSVAGRCSGGFSRSAWWRTTVRWQ